MGPVLALELTVERWKVSEESFTGGKKEREGKERKGKKGLEALGRFIPRHAMTSHGLPVAYGPRFARKDCAALRGCARGLRLARQHGTLPRGSLGNLAIGTDRPEP